MILLMEGIVRLERMDPSRNAFRFYQLELLPDLFDQAALRVSWGRIGRPARQAIRCGGEIDEVVEIKDRIVRDKTRKGYLRVK